MINPVIENIAKRLTVVEVPPSDLDVKVAKAVARWARPVPEKAAQTLTWGADEHVICAVVAGWWLCSHLAKSRSRRASTHVLLVTGCVTVLPHVMKAVFRQKRPDRCAFALRAKGVPLSSGTYDSFPSGHAMHVGAMMSVASSLPPGQRDIIWGIGLGLISTRIILLAHWFSDVAIGSIIGVAIERLLRNITGYPAARIFRRRSRHD